MTQGCAPECASTRGEEAKKQIPPALTGHGAKGAEGGKLIFSLVERLESQGRLLAGGKRLSQLKEPTKGKTTWCELEKGRCLGACLGEPRDDGMQTEFRSVGDSHSLRILGAPQTAMKDC